jgi:iron-sulfur cluster repair protein YtfE (RIC family)
MTIITQPLREEHKELLPHIEKMRQVADAIGEATTEALQHGVDEVIEFLTQHLIPHAQAEDRALYPVVAEVMGAPQATRTMSRDHIEVGRLSDELVSLRANLLGGTLDPMQADALRRVLYGLYTLVKAHFAKEEEIYLPLLDAKLSVKEAIQMFKAMEAAAHEAKAHLGG